MSTHLCTSKHSCGRVTRVNARESYEVLRSFFFTIWTNFQKFLFSEGSLVDLTYDVFTDCFLMVRSKPRRVWLKRYIEVYRPQTKTQWETPEWYHYKTNLLRLSRVIDRLRMNICLSVPSTHIVKRQWRQIILKLNHWLNPRPKKIRKSIVNRTLHV